MLFNREMMLKTDAIIFEKIREFILLLEGNYRKPQSEYTVTEKLTCHIVHIILWFIHKPQISVLLNVIGFFAAYFHKHLPFLCYDKTQHFYLEEHVIKQGTVFLGNPSHDE